MTKPSGGIAVRRAALEILARVERRGGYADVLLGHRAPDFEENDRRLLTRLVLGTIAWRARLDFELARLSSRPLEQIDPNVLEILRLGLFQLRFLDRVPQHAVVDTAVTIATAERNTRNASGFVNAVLRKATRTKRAEPEGDDLDALALRWSHPRWLAERFIATFGRADAERLMASDNEAAPTAIRLNPSRGTREEIIGRIKAAGMQFGGEGRFPETIILRGAPRFDSAAFREGFFHVQSEASQIVARMLAPARGAIVADCAAAPGGKATHLAELIGERGRVVALDQNFAGLRTARAIARRLGHDNIIFGRADVAAAPPLRPSTFEFVLLDAPCTGTGTLREHPEIRWRLRPRDPARMAALQRAMLESAASLVRPGGALVYSVCSLMHEEGPGVVTDFLGAHPDFSIDRHPPGFQQMPELIREDGTMLTRPDRGGLDGFFAARMLRRS